MKIYTLMSEYKRVHTSTNELGVKTIYIDEALSSLGYFDNVQEAEYWMKEIREILTEEDASVTDLYISELELNAAPEFVKVYKELQNIATDEVDGLLKSLMDKGLIEQYVDENGEFVYGLTEEGKQFLKDNPEQDFRDSQNFPDFK